MGAKHLSKRKNWQRGARKTGDKGENDFVKHLAPYLPEHYEIVSKPKKIPIYSNGKGIELDSKIVNHKTGETLFIEKKTGKQGGNTTEERACKFLSSGITDRIKEHYDTPEAPVFIVFSGRTFSGDVYYIERKNKKTGKKTRVKVDPASYQEKVAVLFEGSNYAIAEKGFANIQEIAKQIMEIV
jgi:hypothetical protein